jgi:hypothetical protein
MLPGVLEVTVILVQYFQRRLQDACADARRVGLLVPIFIDPDDAGELVEGDAVEVPLHHLIDAVVQLVLVSKPIENVRHG